MEPNFRAMLEMLIHLMRSPSPPSPPSSPSLIPSHANGWNRGAWDSALKHQFSQEDFSGMRPWGGPATQRFQDTSTGEFITNRDDLEKLMSASKKQHF